MSDKTPENAKNASIFWDICERWGLGGLHFQHAALCPTRLWLYQNKMISAEMDTRVRKGLALHQTHHRKDKSVLGLIGLAPDAVDWVGRVVYERKNRLTDDPGSWAQVEFYGWAFRCSTGDWEWQAKKVGIKERKIIPAILDDNSLQRMADLALKIEQSATTSYPPKPTIKKICGTCSGRFFCGFDGTGDEE